MLLHVYRPTLQRYCCSKTSMVSLTGLAERNYLQFNVEIQVYAHHKEDQFCSARSNPNLSGKPLERVTTYKYLGLLLSSDLSWSQHINNIAMYQSQKTPRPYLPPFLPILHPRESISDVHLNSLSQPGIRYSHLEPIQNQQS